LSDLIEMARKWKEEIDKLNAETDERIRLFLEEGIWKKK